MDSIKNKEERKEGKKETNKKGNKIGTNTGMPPACCAGAPDRGKWTSARVSPVFTLVRLAGPSTASRLKITHSVNQRCCFCLCSFSET